ncbi:cell wall hydrolase [Rhizobium panacihumi]|uniref:cell wall hydrolase n=1 Tax=Rhizobium panacihumi TaxID=2008450 RepID=UPI003D79847A
MKFYDGVPVKNFGVFLWAPALVLSAASLAGCNTTKVEKPVEHTKPAPVPAKQVYHYTAADRECLKRAMYFESKRTSRNGFMAVGTVVMNRLTSGAYPDTICDVVAQKNQFAPGVMTRVMDEATAPDLEGASEAILRGERHADVKDAMFFHTNGLKFPYKNMSYVAVAGGNAFYEKRGRDGELQTPEPLPVGSYMLAMAGQSTPAQQVALNNLVQGAAPQSQTSQADTPQEAAVPGTVAASQPLTTEGETSPMLVPVPMPKPGIRSQQAVLMQPAAMEFQPLMVPVPSPKPGIHNQQAALAQRLVYR